MNEKYKIGMGYDIHRFAKNRRLFLGGVEIPYKKGLLGHSDADVLLHSVCDAILGAIGMDDIGRHFPNTCKKYKGISSALLLGHVYGLCKKQGYKIGNLDITVIAEEPKINPYKGKMKSVISKILKTKNINIKSTTNEGLGAIGKKQGIASYSIALLQKSYT